MKYPTGNPSTLFCEQVGTVTSVFEQWNNCERTVVLYALLKRISYASLKFLQYSIECNLTQNFGSQTQINYIETNANSPGYLQKLIGTYQALPINDISAVTNKDSLLYESDVCLCDGDRTYDKKEDILRDVLTLLPLLKPGNDEAKELYLSLIPLAVEDTVRQIVSSDLVQQVFSYLLIHPAISNEDRRSLSQWLRHLEDHIQSSFATNGHHNFFILSHPSDTSSTLQSSSSTSTSSLNATNTSNTWQAIAPPNQSSHKIGNKTTSTSVNSTLSSNATTDWDLSIIQIHQNICDDLKIPEMNNTTNSPNSLGFIYETSVANSQSHSNNDDHHVSFSKNGTEIIDFDDEINCDKSNTQIAFDSMLPNINEDLQTNNFCSLNSQISSFKTRRSNSLTTTINSSYSSSGVSSIGTNTSTSSENLSQIIQKPRSLSLSIESPRSSIQSSGSETRLDDFKPNYLKFTTHNIGMSNIAPWLKSLRLHKYVWLFTNMTYEKMLDITEEYLQALGVTKGASHKLALCIQKLKDRFNNLTNMEKDLMTNKITVNTTLEELTNIVLTPMKPVDQMSQDNVAGQFLKVLDLVSQIVAKKQVTSSQDEECVNGVLWILEKCIHSEAFVAHTNQLKEHKFKLSKIKMQFVPKSHYTKGGGGNGNLNKPRWNNASKSHKTNNGGGNNLGNSDKSHRKNSNGMPNFNQQQQQQQQQQPSSLTSNTTTGSPFQHDADKYQCNKTQSSVPHAQNQMYVLPQEQQSQQQQQQIFVGNSGPPTNQNTCSLATQYNKSSSYPTFSMNNPKSSPNVEHTQPQQLQQPQQLYRHHRHSLNSLIVLSANPQHQQQITFKTNKQPAGILILNKNAQGNLTNNGNSDKGRKSSLKSGVLTSNTSAVSTPINNINSNGSATTVSITIESSRDSLSSSKIPRKDTNNKNKIGDIDSSLEFLCLQMTEQAIN